MNRIKKINIIVRSNFKSASAYRLLLWEKGWLEEGEKVNIIYLYTRNLNNKFSKLIFLFIQIGKIIFLSANDINLVYGHLPDYIFKLLKRKNITVERTEYPTQVISTGYQNLSWYKSAQKFITCSDALSNYYKPFTNDNCLFHKAPVLVDYNKFAKCKEPNPFKDKKYIAYCGNMGGNKDGLEDLLEAFSIFCNVNHTINLCLLGSADAVVLDNLKTKVKELGIIDRVIFAGYVQHEKMPIYLSNAEVLVLARPNNKQAEGGFPSKLGEYLSTGKPVLVTPVGEIPNYIKNGETGYLCEPENPKLFAEKLNYIFENYLQAQKVGKSGQQLAKIEFDYRVQAKRLLIFLRKS